MAMSVTRITCEMQGGTAEANPFVLHGRRDFFMKSCM